MDFVDAWSTKGDFKNGERAVRLHGSSEEGNSTYIVDTVVFHEQRVMMLDDDDDGIHFRFI